MIKEEMDNTAMVSQTGIINVEVEYNRKQTNNQGDKNEMGYLIEDIDLGLTERPRAQKYISVYNRSLILSFHYFNHLLYFNHVIFISATCNPHSAWNTSGVCNMLCPV